MPGLVPERAAGPPAQSFRLAEAEMKLSTSSSTGCLFAIATLFAGCGSSQSPVPVSVPQRMDHGRSWMVPGAPAIKELLYVSDRATGDVYVFNYQTGASVGQLGGFSYPLGQCVDGRGDVWIANSVNGDGSGTSIVEYAHGGTDPIRTLRTDGYPAGCAIDPVTKALAVVNGHLTSSYGDVEIWTNFNLNPARYANNNCGYLNSPGYDDRGNLYVEGSLIGGGAICEIPARRAGTELTKVSFDKTIHEAAGIMWDGKYLALADTNPYAGTNYAITAIYQAKRTASGGLTTVGTTILKDTCFYGMGDTLVTQPFIVGAKNTPKNRRQGLTVVGGNLDCASRFDYWAYPAGGTPASSLQNAPLMPQGQSVSIAK